MKGGRLDLAMGVAWGQWRVRVWEREWEVQKVEVRVPLRVTLMGEVSGHMWVMTWEHLMENRRG